jgi:ribulose-phosphate 3-epimerase
LTPYPVNTYNVCGGDNPAVPFLLFQMPDLYVLSGGSMSKIVKIVPAILTEDPKALENMVRQTQSFTSYAQFDIMDGQFVPSRSITAEHIAGLTVNLNWEAHLMVLNPENYVADFQRAGAQKIVFHYEATSSPREVISLVRNLGLKAGLAVNPETPVAAIAPLVRDVDSVLFLSVNPGFYGSKFIPEVLEKIVAFHKAYPSLESGIDGGIKESNIAMIARSGVDVIYVGSAIFLQPEPGESFRRLQTLAEANTPGQS